MCAIGTGKKTLCITAGHVFSKYREHVRKYGDIECQIGNVRVDLEKYVVDFDIEYDLAVFELSPVLIAASGIRPHVAPSWPPSALRDKDIVVIGGYPGLLRSEREGFVQSGFVTLLVRVAQSSSSHSAFLLNLENSYWPDGSGGLPDGVELGGMSGGPIFRYVEEPIEFLEIAGFIYEANSKFGIVRGRNAACISSSGKIERYG